MLQLPEAIRNFRRDVRVYGARWWLKFAIRFQIVAPVFKVILRPGGATPLIRLGTFYGGWWVPEAALRPGAVAYCAGAGDDISFDLALHERGMRVVTLDPTPRAIAHAESVAPTSDRFVLVPVGLWNEAAELRFFNPRNMRDVNYSVVNLQDTDDYFIGQVKTLREVMNDLGDIAIDLLKVDIEGAEHHVIQSFLEDGIRPEVVCIEFDQPSPLRAVLRSVRRLQDCGYTLVHIEMWNYTFIHKPASM